MKLSLCIHNFLRESRASFTPQQRMLHGETEEEEEYNYHNTRCLSSYYSIFVARLAIMVMLAILIGLLTMLTWHFTRSYTTNSITSLAYGLRYELLQRPILRMWNILNSTVEITVAQVKLSEYVISQHESSKGHGQAELYEAMRNITWALFASKKALDAITINYTNGFVQAFHRDRRSNNTYYIYSDLINATNTQIQGSPGNHSEIPRTVSLNISAIWYREPLDPVTGNKLGAPSQIPPEDLIQIAGLSELRDGTASWHVAVSKFTESPLLSAALPVRHPSQGNIVAVVGVTTALKSVGQLMRELVEFHSGYMYLTSKDGYLLATSTDAPLLRNTTTGLKLMMANDSEDQMIKSGAEWLWRTYGDQFPISHEIHAENVMLGRERYYIDSFFLNLKRLPLVGVIIIPRRYIMGKVDQIGFTTLIILISASVCILAIGCVCILILTSGVSKAMKLRAALISQLDARRRAEASSNYKSQFLANMSHELRTPMAAVIGLLDILMIDDNLTNEQVATVTQIRKCSTALLRLLNNILDLSKVESGKLVLEEAEFDLGRELEGLVDMFSVHSMSHNVETILDICEGHVILRGWCESSNQSCQLLRNSTSKMPQDALNIKSKQNESAVKRDYKNNERITLWFEVEDTGCGIDPSKWETVFESFEQADPSTTRTHGGTGLGLCIVRNLVNKMGGEIKVKKKEGPGTLMQLYMVLGMAECGQETKKDLSKCNLMVLLAMNSSKGRSITAQWLKDKGVSTWEASEWNGLTQILIQFFRGNMNAKNCFIEHSKRESFHLNRMREKEIDVQKIGSSKVVIIVDTALLDQSTNIWKEQLIFLDQYHGEAKFAWVLSHDTSNAIKVELRRRGNFLMVNKPLYKTKLIQILESVVSQENFEDQRIEISELSTMPSDWSECHEIDPIQFDSISSGSSGISDTENLGSRASAFASGDKRKEELLVTHESNIMQAANNSRTLSRDFGVDKYGITDVDHLVRYNHKIVNKDSVTSEKAKQGHHIDPQLEDPFLAYKRTFCEINQSDYLKRNLKEETNQNHVGAQLCDSKDKALELTDKNSTSVCNLNSWQIYNQNGEQKSTLSPRVMEFKKYQDANFQTNKEDYPTPTKVVPHQNHLGGLCILLAEDNPILQRVAMTMLEKVGAKVVAVGDGMQAVDALKCIFCGEQNATQNSMENEGERQSPKPLQESPPFDLILMDCQMPKLDGYEATKAIRRLEEGTSLHIPIVAVTAHAMSSDQEKCIKVGMDAYLTKPIDSKLMVSTILSLTKKNSSVNHVSQMAGEPRS
ncbi:Histidine kinase protein [Dioscorea alata]|uniref:Histidine kinase protein n=1 Tax=Dioscorea alata TaxID=55571 RepID=A0ACB7V6G9_DIOAL|nr:Histidine kinase protein [Dioscorea alata]